MARKHKAEPTWRDKCAHCGEPIYIEDDAHYGEYYIDTWDGPVHWECWTDYGAKLMKEAK